MFPAGRNPVILDQRLAEPVARFAPEQLELLAQSLAPDDRVVMEATGNALANLARPTRQRTTVDSHVCRLRTRLTGAGAGPVLVNKWGHGWSLTRSDS